MSAAVGMLTRLGIDSASPVTKQFDFLSCNIRAVSDPIDGNGMRGTLEHDISRVRANIVRIAGTIEMEPNQAEWALLWPWILGVAGSGSAPVTYNVADVVLTRFIAAYYNVGNIFTFSSMAVTSATISGTQGQPLRLTLNIIGISEAIAGSFPAISIDRTNGPYLFTDSATTGFSVNSQNGTPKSFTFTIDNHIDPDRYFNSLALISSVKHDRTVSLSFEVPFGDFNTLYNLGVGGINTVLTFTNGAGVLTITMANVVYAREGPTIPGRSELMLPLHGIAYANGATASLVVTQ